MAHALSGGTAGVGLGVRMLRGCGEADGGETPVTEPEGRHPRCYAASRGGCSPRISREHPISETVLRVFGNDDGIEIGGFNWSRGGHEFIGYASLGSNVLCTEHNSALSPLDDTGGALVRRIVDVHTILRLQKRRRPIPDISISGPEWERWMIKCLIGLIVSGQSASPAGEGRDWRPPAAWLDTLFDGAPLPERCGLYMPVTDYGPDAVVPRFSAAPIGRAGGSTYGLRVNWIDKVFVLALDDPGPAAHPGSMLDGAAYRPVRWRDSNSINAARTDLTWGPGWLGPTVNVGHLNPRKFDRRLPEDDK